MVEYSLVRFWPGQKPRIQFIATDFFCFAFRPCICEQPSVRPSLCLFTLLVCSSVRAPIRLYVCACPSNCLSACPSAHLRALERTQKIMYLRHSNKHTYLMICTLNGLHTYRCFCSRYAIVLRAVCSCTAIQRSHYPKVYHICSSLIRVYMRRFFSSAHSISFYRGKLLVQSYNCSIVL